MSCPLLLTKGGQVPALKIKHQCQYQYHFKPESFPWPIPMMCSVLLNVVFIRTGRSQENSVTVWIFNRVLLPLLGESPSCRQPLTCGGGGGQGLCCSCSCLSYIMWFIRESVWRSGLQVPLSEESPSAARLKAQQWARIEHETPSQSERWLPVTESQCGDLLTFLGEDEWGHRSSSQWHYNISFSANQEPRFCRDLSSHLSTHLPVWGPPLLFRASFWDTDKSDERKLQPYDSVGPPECFSTASRFRFCVVFFFYVLYRLYLFFFRFIFRFMS